MGKYGHRLLFLLTTAALAVFVSAPLFGANWQDCSPPGKPNTCFVSASGYTFKTVDSGTCLNPSGTPVGVSSFPQFVPGGYDGISDAKLWCYETTPPAKGTTTSSVSQIDLQVALPYFNPAIIKISGQVFSFNLANGCGGDSTTGFEVGDLEACGVKWTYKVNPGGIPQRFSLMTKVDDKTRNLGAGPVVMLAKVGSAVEPGIILGPAATSSVYGVTGLPQSVCQIINGLPYFFKKDDFGCTESVYLCHDTNPTCDKGGTSESPPPDDYSQWVNVDTCYKLPPKTLKMKLFKQDPSGDLTAINSVPQTLREIGFLGGANACREGVATLQGGCTVVVDVGGVPVSTYYETNPPCIFPLNLTATKSGTSVTLSWIDNNVNEDGTKIYRWKGSTTATDPTASGITSLLATKSTTTKDTTGTVYTYTNSSLGSTAYKYCYKVAAYNATSGVGPASNVVCLTVP